MSLTQGKLEVIKQEMAIVNIDILGISGGKCPGKDEFNSDEHYYLLLWAGIPQKKWSSHHGQQKSPKCSTWSQSQKRQNDLSLFPRQTIHITVIQVQAPISNAEDADVEQIYEDLQDLLALTPKKDVLFILGDSNAKLGS